MRVLWLCNIMLPKIAEYLQKEVSNKEGWLSGTYDRLCKADFLLDSGERLELGVCFPVGNESEEVEVLVDGVMAYGFYEDTAHPENYDVNLESRLKSIVEKFKPDLVHCFGTEYPHTLAMTRAFPYPEKILIGIQGLCSECAKVYMANLPEETQKKKTFRDLLKQDSIKEQRKKFEQRGENEKEALKNVLHVTGRTMWDYMMVREIVASEFEDSNEESLKYHFMNETLRNTFYEDEWNIENAIPYSIFMSQGDYPLKGLHFMLQAMPRILDKFPQTTLWIAGSDITRNKSIMEKIKISGYGKYLRKLMKKYELQEKVHFLGRLSAKQMKERFLKSAVYICPSILENSPNSLGEAMLLGMPSVAANTGGIPTIFFDKKDGLLFEKGNVDALAECVIEMFSDMGKMEQYGKTARIHAMDTHNPDKNYQRLLEIYQEIV